MKPLILALLLWPCTLQAQTGLPAVIDDKDISDNFDYLYERILSNIAPDLSAYLNTSTVFSGDVSGTYGALEVADDSHSHSDTTIIGLEASKLFGPLPAISGASLTGVVHNISTVTARIEAVAVSTGEIKVLLDAVVISTGVINSAVELKLDKTGGNVTGQLTLIASSLTVQGDVDITGDYKINGVAINLNADVVLAATQTFTGINTFNANTVFKSSVSMVANTAATYAITVDSNTTASDGYVFSVSTTGLVDVGFYREVCISGVSQECSVTCATGYRMVNCSCIWPGIVSLISCGPSTTALDNETCIVRITAGAVGANAIISCARIK
jgi:hypothetical protein